MKSILQNWVMELGLRHQGCLISAIRGCDSVPKDDAAKALIRCLRYEILNPHCGDAGKAASFIEKVPRDVLKARMTAVTKNFDHYPVHFILHLMHAAQIIGHCQMTPIAMPWANFYRTMCKKMHVNVETCEQMSARLNADEETFAADNGGPDYPPVPQRSAAEAREHLQQTEAAMEFMTDPKRFLNPNQADPTRPMGEQLPEAFVKGFFDYKAFHVGRASNHYAGAVDTSLEQLWDAGWLAANVAVRNSYADPHPRQEGYDAFYDCIPIHNNPYHGIPKGSQEWTKGWQRAEGNDKFQRSKATAQGHICDGNRGHCSQDCPNSAENRAADASPSYVNQDQHGFDSSGFYQGHKPSVKELDELAARNYRGVRS